MTLYVQKFKTGISYRLVATNGKAIKFGILNSGKRVDFLTLIELDTWAQAIPGLLRSESLLFKALR
jgi:hypothetical protein